MSSTIEQQANAELAKKRAKANGDAGAFKRESPPLSAYADEDDPVAIEKIRSRHIAAIVADKRSTDWLLLKVLEALVLAVIAGPRGTFKSFIALHWVMLAAKAGRGAYILSAEGGGLGRRIDGWMRAHAPSANVRQFKVHAIERPLNLNCDEVLTQVKADIAALPFKVAVILIDTMSKYSPGLDENDNSLAAAFLSRLAVQLRDALQATVLLVAHTGHGDATRPRGAYSLMSNPDAEYIVARPDAKGMLVTISRERFKDSESLPPIAYTARVMDLGYVDENNEAVTTLVLDDADAPATKPKAMGANQTSALVALREWARANPSDLVIASPDLGALLKRQGVTSKRKPEVLNWLVNAGVLTTSVGGHTVNRQSL
jgi:hypothetical protein